MKNRILNKKTRNSSNASKRRGYIIDKLLKKNYISFVKKEHVQQCEDDCESCGERCCD